METMNAESLLNALAALSAPLKNGDRPVIIFERIVGGGWLVSPMAGGKHVPLRVMEGSWLPLLVPAARAVLEKEVGDSLNFQPSTLNTEPS